jgi:hypothetical protein
LKPALAATPDPVHQNSDEPLPEGKIPKKHIRQNLRRLIRLQGI